MIDRVLTEVDAAAEEIVEFTRDLIRIPTVNPPGDDYETCARFLGDRLEHGIQTACVADRCRAVVDRRFLSEEGFACAKEEVTALIARVLESMPGIDYQLRDLMVVEPVKTPDGSPLVRALEDAIRHVLGANARLVASPGTYDHKHIARIAGIPDCVAYGPGEIELAHQPDESCAIADLLHATKVIALATLELAQGRS